MCTISRDELVLNGLQHSVLGSACDVACEAPAVATPKRDLGARGWWGVRRIALDRTRAGGATKRAATSIAGNQMKCLRRVVRVRTWLSHAPSPMGNRELSSESPPTQEK
jgi:hypothetical protein